MGNGTRIRFGLGLGLGKGSITKLESSNSHLVPPSPSSSRPQLGKLQHIPTSVSDDEGYTQRSSIHLPTFFEDIVPEIIVRTDDMDLATDEAPSPHTPAAKDHTLDSAAMNTPSMPQIDGPADELGPPIESSVSIMTDQSELSSPPPTVSSKATTPVDRDSSRDALTPSSQPPIIDSSKDPSTPVAQIIQPLPNDERPEVATPVAGPSAVASSTDAHIQANQPLHINTSQGTPRRTYDVRPKVSLPPSLQPHEYAMQCIAAAESSRLNPYALHEDEYLLLRHHISHAQVTTYLNIRNGVLRLWVLNPQIAVTREEAIGCTKDIRWFDVASVCFDWLVRRGYINFGCVEIKSSRKSPNKDSPKKAKRATIVVIGAGMSGLGCARQLEGLFLQYYKRFRDIREDLPEVVLLEGRNRIGGRVYSRAFKSKPAYSSPAFEGKRYTAEMGGMIITGFDRGNPLNILVRGQLSLAYHALRPDTTLYDSNGKPVDQDRDQLVENLFNDCLDRVSEYKFKSPPTKLIEGNRDLIDEGRDSLAEVVKTIAHVEEITAAQPHAPPVSELSMAPQVDLVPVSSDRVTGKVHVEPGTPGMLKASYKARLMGWPRKLGFSDEKELDLELATRQPGSTLGSVTDNAISQYSGIVDLNAQDYRLINWHIANLEYSNAINYSRLSLQGWDIDAGNEWEGKHTMIVGGYQSVPRGLMHCPTLLNIRQKSAVKRISYSVDGSSRATVECEDGHTVDADYVVSTIPLGVLKHGNVQFEPGLPSWKTDAITRLGFGVLNKVILVYKEAFWDENRDIFGVLRDPLNRHSLDQRDYSAQRGRFFQWFNVSNTSGLPVLLALMAGDAGFDTEQSCNDDLVAEATSVLRSVFGASVPDPIETVVTRWASDRFARGSYSSAGPDMRADDYDIMARRIGNLFFAGEHTTGTHPATVHGAYLSGLRAASEVVDAILGPIEVPTPLIRPKESSLTSSLKRKLAEEKNPAQARLEAYEIALWDHIIAQIGLRPLKPAKPATNAYLFYSKAHYDDARRRCEEGRRQRPAGKAGGARTSANDVRVMSAKMWRDATPEARRPFEERAEQLKKAHAEALRVWGEQGAEWDRKATGLKAEYEKANPPPPPPPAAGAEDAGAGEGRERRGKRKVESYAEDETSDVEVAL